ncbi:MAG: cell division topological specificity factor MinE [Hyphomicrobiales bacterium]|nr:cell division topological specificity factor MinE [Hyphomicrobiales bacterium]
MSILDFFRTKQKAPQTASYAKERLKIVLAHERSYDAAPDYLPMLQNEIMEVIAKYVNVDRDDLSVNLETLGTTSRLEVNVEFPNDDVRMFVDFETPAEGGGLRQEPNPKDQSQPDHETEASDELELERRLVSS